jgi:hypothetical protein
MFDYVQQKNSVVTSQQRRYLIEDIIDKEPALAWLCHLQSHSIQVAAIYGKIEITFKHVPRNSVSASDF